MRSKKEGVGDVVTLPLGMSKKGGMPCKGRSTAEGSKED